MFIKRQFNLRFSNGMEKVIKINLNLIGNSIEIEYRKTKPEIIDKLEKTLQNRRIGVVIKKHNAISDFGR